MIHKLGFNLLGLGCKAVRFKVTSHGLPPSDEGMYPEKDHLLTANVYSCIEINAHLILCLVISVVEGKLPKQCLLIWTTGSQACEQMFRLLRSMSGTFSTMVNFTLKGILERIQKLNYIASIECTDEIVFPRVKRRLLHLNEE